MDDMLGVIEHFSPGGSPPYDVTYDRGPLAGPPIWNFTAPDGVIDLPNDILGMLFQYHHDCAIAPPPGPTPTASAGLAFSIGVDTDGDTTDDCSTSGGTVTCTILDTTFTLNVYLDSLPNGVSNYVALNTAFTYSGVASSSHVSLGEWADCTALQSSYTAPGKAAMACISYVIPPASPSTYTGLIGAVEFTCASGGKISMEHGEIDTALFEDASTFHIEGNASTETLTINCNGPTPTDTPTPSNTPTPKNPDGDGDGDGMPNSMDPNDDNDACTDDQENGPDETLGGLRNPHNPWDFYDVRGPGQSLITDGLIDLPNDILSVILGFSPQGLPPYDESLDRGVSSGPYAWNMTAPDGVIDLPNDILGVILQFDHNCT